MSWGDVPGWVALVVALVAASLSWRSLRWEKQSAEAAVQSANEAARANLIAERALESKPTDPALAPGQPAGPRVTWSIEKISGAEYVLRNTGSEIAEHVYADKANAPVLNRNLPQDSVIRPGAGHKMLLKGSWQSPVPTELHVRWSGQDAWVAVPLPG